MRSNALLTKPHNYPCELERWVTVDGKKVFVRPVVPGDAEALGDALRTADPETLYHRFFTPAPRIDAQRIEYLTTLDYDRRLAVAAFLEDGTGLAIARYEGRAGADDAEVAFTVKEAYRRHGLASLLYSVLEEAAVARGIRRFDAVYLVENRAVADLLHHVGFGPPAQSDGVAEVSKVLEGHRYRV